MFRPRLVALFAAALLALAACSGSASTTPTTSAAASAAVPSASAAGASAPASSAPGASTAAACAPASGSGTVAASIKNFAFSPNPVTAKVGDTITWTNGDSAAHTVSLDDGSCTTPHIDGGSTSSLTFSAPGTYPFHCNVHPNMKGTIEITA